MSEPRQQHEPQSGHAQGQQQQQQQQQGAGTVDIDETIGQVERLYRTVTGHEAPPNEKAYAPIPAERDPAEHVEECMDRLLRALGSTPPAAVQAEWVPPVSVWESDSEFLLCVDLPGVQREHVQVVTRANQLTVSGSRPAPDHGAFHPRAVERPLGRFRRTVMLPAALQAIQPDARIRDGVLEVHLRKQESQKESQKPIEVR